MPSNNWTDDTFYAELLQNYYVQFHSSAKRVYRKGSSSIGVTQMLEMAS